MDNNNIIDKIILSQVDFHRLPRDKDGYCVYDGDYFCNNCNIHVLPYKFKVNGTLNCTNNKLTSLPDGLIIGRDLYCHENSITKEIKCEIGGGIFMDEEQRLQYDRIIKLNKIKAIIDDK